jgi:hypothetical protein
MINNNTNITKEIKAGLGLSELTGYPRKVADAIIPVLPVNKKYCNVVRSTLLIAPTTLYTTPTNKDFYLCSAYVNISDMNGTGVRILTATIDNEAQVILQVQTVSDDAVNGSSCSNSINPVYPIKIDRGTNIVASGTGVDTYGAVGIIGYTEDVTGD